MFGRLSLGLFLQLLRLHRKILRQQRRLDHCEVQYRVETLNQQIGRQQLGRRRLRPLSW